jgi:predicted DNA-binding transcriptional regulator AlpA
MGEQILDSAGVADMVGLTVNTVHTYHSRGSMPPADLYLGDNPGWYESTIRAWIAERDLDAERDRMAKAARAARRKRYKKG